MCVRGPNNVGGAVQTDPTLLRYAPAITEQKKCWELLAEKCGRFQTLRNNMQQGVQTDATCNIQQCWELLANNIASVCTGLNYLRSSDVVAFNTSEAFPLSLVFPLTLM